MTNSAVHDNPTIFYFHPFFAAPPSFDLLGGHNKENQHHNGVGGHEDDDDDDDFGFDGSRPVSFEEVKQLREQRGELYQKAARAFKAKQGGEEGMDCLSKRPKNLYTE